MIIKRILFSILILTFSGASYSALFEYKFEGTVTSTTGLDHLLDADVEYVFHINFDEQGQQTVYGEPGGAPSQPTTISDSSNVFFNTDYFLSTFISGSLIETGAGGWSNSPTDVASAEYGTSVTGTNFCNAVIGPSQCGPEGTLFGDSSDDLTKVFANLLVQDWKKGTEVEGYERIRDTNTGALSDIKSTLYLADISEVPVIQNPVPAAVWLFGTALIGFVGFSRRTAVT